MTVDTDHEAAIRQLFEGVWNGSDPTVADDLVHPDYVIHDRPIDGDRRGPDLYRTLAERTAAVFPDMAYDIDDLIVCGESVALRWTMTGTHEGPLMGLEPTGKTVELSAIEIDRFRDGQLRETWVQNDMLGALEQLGVDPTG